MRQARRWLKLARDASPECGCGECGGERLERVVAEFERRAGDDLAALRAVSRIARAGHLESGGEMALAAVALGRLWSAGGAADRRDVLDSAFEQDVATYTFQAYERALAGVPLESILPQLERILGVEPGPDVRHTALDLLAARSERRPEILALLEDALAVDPDYAAMALARYGDPAAIPALHAALGSATISTPPDPHGGQEIFELADAIESLGGSLHRAELELLGRARRLRERYFARAFSSPALPERADPTTPPNAPCLCGSGRKFKKCCA